MDSQASNFDPELRQRIADALDQINDVTAAVSRASRNLARGLSIPTGVLPRRRGRRRSG